MYGLKQLSPLVQASQLCGFRPFMSQFKSSKIYGGFSNIKPGQLYVPKSTFDFLNEFRFWCRKQDFQTSKTFQFCLTQQIMFKSNPITKELVALLKKSDFMTFLKCIQWDFHNVYRDAFDVHLIYYPATVSEDFYSCWHRDNYPFSIVGGMGTSHSTHVAGCFSTSQFGDIIIPAFVRTSGQFYVVPQSYPKTLSYSQFSNEHQLSLESPQLYSFLDGKLISEPSRIVPFLNRGAYYHRHVRENNDKKDGVSINISPCLFDPNVLFGK